MTDGFDSFPFAEPLRRGLERAGFDMPTPVQTQALPAALAGADLLVSAATGSGKTAAFLLPLMQRLLDRPASRGATRALILAPTRELARQIHEHALRLGSYTRLQLATITGGPPRTHQIPALRKNPEVLIATPGRLLDHLGAGEVDLGDLEVLVLDEADRLLDLGFADDVLRIIGQCRADRQTLLFSATLHHRRLRELIGAALREPVALTIDSPRVQHPDISHQMILSDGDAHKEQQLLWLLQQEPTAGATLVFANKRERSATLGALLVAHGARAGVLHGEMDQRERNRVIGLLRRGLIATLVATDVAARGLDIPTVARVINFDLPRSGDDYLHRSGRTGRAGAKGSALSLVAAADWNRMESIARYLGLDVEQRAIAGLKASYKGGGRRGKPAPSAAARARKPSADAAATKRKDRWRERKQIGKRRAPTRQPSADAGWEPPRRASD